MIKVNITIQGLNESFNFLSGLPRVHRDGRKTSFQQIGNRNVEKMKDETPVKTGTLRNGEKVSQVDPNSLIIESPVGYSGYVNFGTIRQRSQQFFSNMVTRTTKELEDDIIRVTNSVISSKGRL